MVNKKILDYFNTYKDKYPIESLKNSLLQQGNSLSEIEEAINIVSKSETLVSSDNVTSLGAENSTISTSRRFPMVIMYVVIGLFLTGGGIFYFFQFLDGEKTSDFGNDSINVDNLGTGSDSNSEVLVEGEIDEVCGDYQIENYNLIVDLVGEICFNGKNVGSSTSGMGPFLIGNDFVFLRQVKVDYGGEIKTEEHVIFNGEDLGCFAAYDIEEKDFAYVLTDKCDHRSLSSSKTVGELFFNGEKIDDGVNHVEILNGKVYYTKWIDDGSSSGDRLAFFDGKEYGDFINNFQFENGNIGYMKYISGTNGNDGYYEVYYNGENVGDGIKLELSGDDFMYVEGDWTRSNNIVFNGEKIDNLCGEKLPGEVDCEIDNGNLACMDSRPDYSMICYNGEVLTNEGSKFIMKDGHYAYFIKSSNVEIDDSLSAYEMGYYKRELIYDGKNLGHALNFKIFGDKILLTKLNETDNSGRYGLLGDKVLPIELISDLRIIGDDIFYLSSDSPGQMFAFNNIYFNDEKLIDESEVISNFYVSAKK